MTVFAVVLEVMIRDRVGFLLAPDITGYDDCARDGTVVRANYSVGERKMFVEGFFANELVQLLGSRRKAWEGMAKKMIDVTLPFADRVFDAAWEELSSPYFVKG